MVNGRRSHSRATTVSVTLFNKNKNKQKKTITTTSTTIRSTSKDKRDEGAELTKQQKDKRCGDNAASDKRLDGWIVLHLGTRDPETATGIGTGIGTEAEGHVEGGKRLATSEQANKPTEKRDDCT